jgi:CRP-like cAMP-binding protein
MSEHAAIEELAAAPIFAGFAREELAELARVMRRRTMAVGDVLWQQGSEAKGMALVVEGRVAVTLRLPGDRQVELADVGPAETIGELPLIDGGPHSATARATEAGSLLLFNRVDFLPFVSRDDPSAFAIKRRFAAVTVARLRRQLEYLASTLGPADPDPVTVPAELDRGGAPDSTYLGRMATFRAVEPQALEALLGVGRVVGCARGITLEQEGGPSAAFRMVINGAIEKVLVRGDRRIRVGLAGPGQAFGYEGLVDGQPAPATAIARERALLLEIPGDAFTSLFGGLDAASLAFLDIVNRDTAEWLRRAMRPQAQLAVRQTAQVPVS